MVVRRIKLVSLKDQEELGRIRDDAEREVLLNKEKSCVEAIPRELQHVKTPYLKGVV